MRPICQLSRHHALVLNAKKIANVQKLWTVHDEGSKGMNFKDFNAAPMRRRSGLGNFALILSLLSAVSVSARTRVSGDVKAQASPAEMPFMDPYLQTSVERVAWQDSHLARSAISRRNGRMKIS